MAVPKRRNGLHRPYSSAQIGGFVALLLTMIEFALFVTPILPMAASIPVTIVFFLLVTATLYYGIAAQYVDPMDDYLKQSLRDGPHTSNNNNNQTMTCWDTIFPAFPIKRNDEEETKQCWICDVQVASHAMHCKFCNKCVANFDHHCMCK